MVTTSLKLKSVNFLKNEVIALQNNAWKNQKVTGYDYQSEMITGETN